MAQAEGILIFFDERRRADLLQNFDERGIDSFSDALSVLDWKIKTQQVALISFSNDTIDYMSLALKGNKVVTGKSRIEFNDFIPLDSIPITEIDKRLKSSIRKHFIKSTKGFGAKVPKATWKNVISVIKEMRPSQSDEIDRLLALKDLSEYHISGENTEILLQEREALGIALDIFEGGNKLRKKVLGSWAPKKKDLLIEPNETFKASLKSIPPARASFLSGIASKYLQEESAIQHDLFNWSGISTIHNSGATSFTIGDRTLHVFYANRNKLEKTTGVDLIYFNEKYNSFILVQYKLMKQENGEMIYRPDKQLKEELKRMDKFVNLHNIEEDMEHHADLRLSDDGFMLKLVPNQGLIPTSNELIRGMYLTRKYMHFLLSAKGSRGPRGGNLISYQNAPRYITNTEFANFVNRGWIGTKGNLSNKLQKLIKHFYETGNALIVASEKESQV